MSKRTAILTLAAGIAIFGVAIPGAAGAVTLTSSLAAFQAGVGASNVTNTANTGLANPFALNLPTTSVIPLGDGQTLQLSTMAQVTQAQNGFPYALSDGFSGDLLIAQDAAGDQVSTETIIPTSGSLSAFGFEVVPFSSTLGGPYAITVTLAGGQSLTQSAPGGDFNTGTTVPDFFGYFGGPIASLTITTTDPNGLAFGNFVDVPEPGSAMLVMAGILGLAGRARRKA